MLVTVGEPRNMAHGAEMASPAAVEVTELVPELGMASAAHGCEVRTGAGMLSSQLVAAAVRHDVCLGAMYDNSGELAHQVPPGAGRAAVHANLGVFASQARPGAGRGEVHVGVLRGDPGVMRQNPGTFSRQLRPSAGRGEEIISVGVARGELGLLQHDNSGTFGNQLVGMLPDGLRAVNVDFGEFAPRPRPDAGLRGDLGLLYGNAGTFARDFRPVAGREEELVGLLPDGLVAVYNYSGNFARQPRPGAGRAEGIVVALLDPNPGAQSDDLGTLAEHLRRLLPVAGILASSAAVTAVAAGTASPAAGFGLFTLLLCGISLVTIHVLRA